MGSGEGILWLSDCLLLAVSSHGGRGALWHLFYKGTNPIPEHLPKFPPPNTMILSVRISTFEFLENTNIQTIAAHILEYGYIIAVELAKLNFYFSFSVFIK